VCAATGCDATQTRSASALSVITITLKDIYGNPRVGVPAVDGTVPGNVFTAGQEDGIVVYLQSDENPNDRMYAAVTLTSGSTYGIVCVCFCCVYDVSHTVCGSRHSVGCFAWTCAGYGMGFCLLFHWFVCIVDKTFSCRE
jgi:hypothetical protein